MSHEKKERESNHSRIRQRAEKITLKQLISHFNSILQREKKMNEREKNGNIVCADAAQKICIINDKRWTLQCIFAQNS